MGKRLWLIIGLIVLVCLTGLIIAGYWFNWDWTGFTQHIGPQVPQYQPTKTLWDWLQLLIIPVVLAIAALLFNQATTRTEQKIAATRYKQDQEIAATRYKQDQEIVLDKQREDLLQAYLDRISELLLEKNLATSPGEAARNVARVRTITILFQLDSRRIGYVFAFLREAGLMSTEPKSNIVSFWRANFNKINLSGASLHRANLSGANLSQANLRKTHFLLANLTQTNFFRSDLTRADLTEANLTEADFYGAKLIEADLTGANLSGANLYEADLSGANLNNANLSYANLTKTVITEEQLKQAKSLAGATMPDGSKHS